MSLSLVLVLLPGILSQEVCLNISNGDIDMQFQNLTVNDAIGKPTIQCMEDKSCYIYCTHMSDGSKLFGNQSSVCLKANYLENSRHFNTYPRYVSCRVYLCTRNETKVILGEMDSGASGEKTLVEMHLLRRMCADIFHDDIQRYFLQVELRIIHTIMGYAPPVMGQVEHFDLKYMAFEMFSITDANLSADTTNSLQVGHSSVWLPVEALGEIPEDQRLVNVVNYPSSQSFKLREEEIVSIVTRIEFLGMKHLSNLKSPVIMTFDVKSSNISLLRCCFVDEEVFEWKTDGCQTFVNGSVVTCHCKHTTAFSVLLIPQPIGQIHWEILSYISYIGCGLSAFCSALSLMIYVTHRKQREEPSLFIHVSLSGALFLLNSSFLLTEWGATVNQDWVCGLIAALVHYSLLGTFTWLAVEGLHLYLMLIKVFNTVYSHYLLKLSLFGWGIPAVVVGVTLSMKDVKQIYGLTELTMLDSNQTNSICWIMDKTYLYVTNGMSVALVFILNCGVLLIVAVRICSPAAAPGGRPRPGCRNASTVVGLTGLLGVTWGLAFLSSGYVNYPILYLFCIFNSTQGVFLLIWILCSSRNARNRAFEASTVGFSTTDSKVILK